MKASISFVVNEHITHKNKKWTANERTMTTTIKDGRNQDETNCYFVERMNKSNIERFGWCLCLRLSTQIV